MFSSGWLNCFPAKLFIPLKKYTSRDYELLGLGSDHMCRKGTSSLGWMQPRWWQQIRVWHWAYAFPIRYMLGPFSLPCPGKSIITFKPLYFQRSGPHGPPVFTPSTVVCYRKSRWILSYLWGHPIPHTLGFTFSMATELIPQPYCGKSSLEFKSSFARVIL